MKFCLVPVLKHGSRSLLHTQADCRTITKRNKIKKCKKYIREIYNFCFECMQWDPKGGELYLGKVNAGETLLKAYSNTDVQIVCET